MTDTPAPAADEQPHPFDPDLPGHIAELIAAWQFDGATQKITFAGRDGNARMLSLGQLAQLLERDAYAETTRLQLAEGSHKLRGQLDVARAERTAALGRVTAAEKALNNAYNERAQLVALLAAIYPSTWGIDPDWTDWHVVYVQLPTGQASWHISPSDRELFAHVSGPAGDWDGHTTDEKYERIRALVTQLAAEKKA